MEKPQSQVWLFWNSVSWASLLWMENRTFSSSPFFSDVFDIPKHTVIISSLQQEEIQRHFDKNVKVFHAATKISGRL